MIYTFSFRSSVISSTFKKMSHIYYKFASELTFSNVNFDGLHISVSDLKKAIIHQKRLGKSSDFDLQVRKEPFL